MSSRQAFEIISDVHGKTAKYLEIINNTDLPTIQLGDLGFKTTHDWFIQNVWTPDLRHRVMFGNHDYYPYLDKPYSCGNFAAFDNGRIVTIRGAASIDKIFRTEGEDWFENEELNFAEAYQALEFVLQTKPEIIISHDCPDIAKNVMFAGRTSYSSRTSNLLTGILDAYKPKQWIFGHWHQSTTANIEGVQFRCLAELESIVV